jgi:CRP-like cAMP-binding protein
MTAAKTFETKLYEPGEIIIAQGSAGGHLAYIMAGRVEIVKEVGGGDSEVVAVLGTGDILGEIALLTGQPRNASARAAEKTWIIQVNERTFRLALINEELPVMKDIVTQLARRLQAMEAENMRCLLRIRELEKRVGDGQERGENEKSTGVC